MSPNFAKMNTVIRYPPPITIRGNHSLIFLFISFTTIIFNKLCYSAPAVEIKTRFPVYPLALTMQAPPKKVSWRNWNCFSSIFFTIQPSINSDCRSSLSSWNIFHPLHLIETSPFFLYKGSHSECARTARATRPH